MRKTKEVLEVLKSLSEDTPIHTGGFYNPENDCGCPVLHYFVETGLLSKLSDWRSCGVPNADKINDEIFNWDRFDHFAVPLENKLEETVTRDEAIKIVEKMIQDEAVSAGE